MVTNSAEALALLDQEVAFDELSTKLVGALKMNKVSTYFELCQLSEAHILREPGVGRISLRALKDHLASRNLRLGMDLPEDINELQKLAAEQRRKRGIKTKINDFGDSDYFDDVNFAPVKALTEVIEKVVQASLSEHLEIALGEPARIYFRCALDHECDDPSAIDITIDGLSTAQDGDGPSWVVPLSDAVSDLCSSLVEDAKDYGIEHPQGKIDIATAERISQWLKAAAVQIDDAVVAVKNLV